MITVLLPNSHLGSDNDSMRRSSLRLARKLAGLFSMLEDSLDIEIFREIADVQLRYSLPSSSS
jgi:hypothetical protein